MTIKIHVVRVPVTAPHSASPVTAPTRGEVEVAARAIATQLGQDETFARSLFDFAVKSISTARAAVEYAEHLIRCGVGRAKVTYPPRNKREVEEVERPLRRLHQTLDAVGKGDEKEGGERVLNSAPLGRKLDMVPGERQYLVEILTQVFSPPKGTPPEKELYRVVVGHGGWHLRFGDWLTRQLLSEEQTTEYEEALKGLRAEDAAEPAPETDETEAETEAEDEPAAEVVSA